MRIAFDVKLRRPGCVLLQAALRCDSSVVMREFPAETWLTFPTPDLEIYEALPEHIPRLVAMAKKAVLEGTNP